MRDLSYLQRLTLFAGLFFASSSVFGGRDGGGDAGGGDGGGSVVTEDGGAGDEGTGDGDGTEGDGTAGDEGIPEESDESIEGDGTEQEEGADKSAPKPLTDKEVEQRLNKLRKTDPQLASQFRKDHFQLKDYRRAGTPSEVMEMRETLESVGGPEGLADVQNKADTFASELVQLSNGDTDIIDTLAQDYPQSVAKLAPYAMDKLRQLNPQAFERSASGITSSFLKDKGVTASIVRLGDIIRAGGEHAQKDSFELVSKLINWAQQTEEYGRSKPADEGPSDAEKRIQQREQELNKTQSTIKNREIGTAITSTMNDIIGRQLAPYLKGRTLTLPQKQLLAKEAYNHISGTLQGNDRYQAAFKALVKKGNIKEIQRFVGAKVSEIAEKSVRSAWSASGHGAIKRKVEAGTGSSNNTVARTNKIPEPHKIDWAKDPGRTRYLRGEVTLKKDFGGRVVRFNPNELQ